MTQKDIGASGTAKPPSAHSRIILLVLSYLTGVLTMFANIDGSARGVLQWTVVRRELGN